MANKQKSVGKIAGTILNIILIIVMAVLAIGIYYIIQIKVLNKEYANVFGYTFFEVATGSMYPTIEVGDVVIVKLTNDTKENDIIVYKEGKDIITHRLIRKENDTLITKGDANNSVDKSIMKQQVLGQVIYILPEVGIWRKILLTPQILGLITIVVLLLGALFMYSPNNKTEDENNDKQKN